MTQTDREGAARFPPGTAGRVLRLFPVDAAQFENLRSAMSKLRLNDASFSFEMETSRLRSASASAAAFSACSI